MNKTVFIFLLQFVMSVYMKDPKPFNMTQYSPMRDNPGFIRDRKKTNIMKPEMPSTWATRLKKPFDPAWMHYCDPYHCNGYHRPVCGLNRANMRFQWFQSICHLILNNQCANFRLFYKFDLIETKFCTAYVQFLREGCPSNCPDEIEPVCGMSPIDGHFVIFKNECFLDAANCNNSTVQEYDKVFMGLCQYIIFKDEKYLKH